MLAIMWALEHFHLYLYGSEFTIVTDHKPLLGIFNSHKPTSARMDRWKLRLMPCNCHLVYRPGKDAENPADFMSRHPNLQATAERNVADGYVNYVCTNAVPKAMTLQEIKVETEKDSILQSQNRCPKKAKRQSRSAGARGTSRNCKDKVPNP